FFHPLIWVGLGPIVLAYYLVFAPRHGPAWHLGLLGITFAGIAPNVWWLIDWGKYWWLRQGVGWDQIPLPDWAAIVGHAADYPVLFACMPGGLAAVVAGVVGLVLLWRSGHRTAAWLALLATVLSVAAARLAGAWPALSADVPDRIIVLAAGFMLPPTIYGL